MRTVPVKTYRREYTVWRSPWQLQLSGYMLAYCVFNTTSAAISL